ncbi:MAG: sn-glycerol-3-phosphate ABC transporter ATP-binding protein UgpC [Synergistaceae bacterium]|nr:sn-glycerol-3-phosphate ABC transporter ATP-binding protein UgpC [Synergistaceae bacterium]
MAGLSLQHIWKKYPNGYEAVKDFNLEIADKEFIIFVGPSGCGKSTTLRMIAGLEDISSGTLKIGDRVVNDVESKDRDIAMVFQNYALYPHMTVYDNMAFALMLKKTPKDEIDKAVREAARILELEKVLDRRPSQLSGGQRQRVAMGRAIVRNPQVFLMDEPLSNLDAKLRVQMRAEIAKLHDRLGATIIYVTHDQTEAMTLGTRIVVMKDGIVQQVASPTVLYNKPDNIFVAGFIGSPQMNFIDARFDGNDLIAGGTSFEIPNEKVDVLREKGYTGKTVIMGVRPENVYDAKAEALCKLTAPFKAKITVFELLGSEVQLYFDFAGASMSAKVGQSSRAAVGDVMSFAFDMDKIHVFDKETEQAIIH